jgi:hypothetical protein
MSAPVILPPVTITKGVEYVQRYVFSLDEAGEDPIDLTGWVGEFSLSTRPFAKPFYTAEVDLEGDRGGVVVTIPDYDTASDEFVPLPILGGSANVFQQIKLTAPDPSQSQVWQGPVTIAGVF